MKTADLVFDRLQDWGVSMVFGLLVRGQRSVFFFNATLPASRDLHGWRNGPVLPHRECRAVS